MFTRRYRAFGTRCLCGSGLRFSFSFEGRQGFRNVSLDTSARLTQQGGRRRELWRFRSVTTAEGWKDKRIPVILHGVAQAEFSLFLSCYYCLYVAHIVHCIKQGLGGPGRQGVMVFQEAERHIPQGPRSRLVFPAHVQGASFSILKTGTVLRLARGGMAWLDLRELEGVHSEGRVQRIFGRLSAQIFPSLSFSQSLGSFPFSVSLC